MSKIDELIGEFSNASMDWVKAPRHCPDKIKRYKDACAALRTAFEELESQLAEEREAYTKLKARVDDFEIIAGVKLPDPAPESGEK